MNILIYGSGKCGEYIYQKINGHGNSQIKVLGWIDKNKKQLDTELPCFTVEEFLQSNWAGIDAVLVATVNDTYMTEMVLSLRNGGYEEIYVVDLNHKASIWESEILDCEGSFGPLIVHFRNIKPVMRYVDFMINEHCNLNCKRCSFFSNIAAEKYADINSFVNAVNGLKVKFSNLKFFVLLGGEPLLNPHLVDYIKIVRDAFPKTNLKVTTNGLLVTRMPDELLDALRKYQVTLRISQYPPTTKMLQQITDFLIEKNIQFFFTEPITFFDKFICNGTENPEVGFEANCSEVQCPEIYDGRLFSCSLIPAIYKNQKFLRFSISKEELKKVSFDLFDRETDGWTILEKIYRPNPLCRYCTIPESMEWSSYGKHCKEDYFVERSMEE